MDEGKRREDRRVDKGKGRADRGGVDGGKGRADRR